MGSQIFPRCRQGARALQWPGTSRVCLGMLSPAAGAAGLVQSGGGAHPDGRIDTCPSQGDAVRGRGNRGPEGHPTPNHAPASGLAGHVGWILPGPTANTKCGLPGTSPDAGRRGGRGRERLCLVSLPPATCSRAVLQMFTGVFTAQAFSSLGLSWFHSSGSQVSHPPTSAVLGRVAGGQCLTIPGLAPGGQRSALPRESGQGISCPDGLGAALLLPLSASVSPSVNAPSEGSCGASERLRLDLLLSWKVTSSAKEPAASFPSLV